MEFRSHSKTDIIQKISGRNRNAIQLNCFWIPKLDGIWITKNQFKSNSIELLNLDAFWIIKKQSRNHSVQMLATIENWQWEMKSKSNPRSTIMKENIRLPHSKVFHRYDVCNEGKQKKIKRTDRVETWKWKMEYF